MVSNRRRVTIGKQPVTYWLPQLVVQVPSVSNCYVGPNYLKNLDAVRFNYFSWGIHIFPYPLLYPSYFSIDITPIEQFILAFSIGPFEFQLMLGFVITTRSRMEAAGQP
jgi:hypothetical protein